MRYKSQLLAAVVAGLLLSSASAHGQAVNKTGKPGKPQAPVEITGVVQSSAAALTITFKSACDQVNVRVYGTDGLTVSGTETPVTARTFAAGETLKLAIAFTPGAGQSNLAVVVTGEFAGKARSRIASFTVGDKRVGARAIPSTIVDEKGRRIIVLPAKDR